MSENIVGTSKFILKVDKLTDDIMEKLEKSMNKKHKACTKCCKRKLYRL